MPGTATASPQQALAVYAEPLVAGRRVVVFGEADTLTDRRLVVPGKEAAPWKGAERRTPPRPKRPETPAACSL